MNFPSAPQYCPTSPLELFINTEVMRQGSNPLSGDTVPETRQPTIPEVFADFRRLSACQIVGPEGITTQDMGVHVATRPLGGLCRHLGEYGWSQVYQTFGMDAIGGRMYRYMGQLMQSLTYRIRGVSGCFISDSDGMSAGIVLPSVHDGNTGMPVDWIVVEEDSIGTRCYAVWSRAGIALPRGSAMPALIPCMYLAFDPQDSLATIGGDVDPRTTMNPAVWVQNGSGGENSSWVLRPLNLDLAE